MLPEVPTVEPKRLDNVVIVRFGLQDTIRVEVAQTASTEALVPIPERSETTLRIHELFVKIPIRVHRVQDLPIPDLPVLVRQVHLTVVVEVLAEEVEVRVEAAEAVVVEVNSITSKYSKCL